MGEDFACKLAGMLYLEGVEIEKDIRKAKYYLQKSCKLGSQESCIYLAEIKEMEKSKSKVVKNKKADNKNQKAVAKKSNIEKEKISPKEDKKAVAKEPENRQTVENKITKQSEKKKLIVKKSDKSSVEKSISKQSNNKNLTAKKSENLEKSLDDELVVNPSEYRKAIVQRLGEKLTEGELENKTLAQKNTKILEKNELPKQPTVNKEAVDEELEGEITSEDIKKPKMAHKSKDELELIPTDEIKKKLENKVGNLFEKQLEMGE